MIFIERNTYLFRLTAIKNGIPWNLTGATVKFVLISPSKTAVEKAASITDAAGGIAEYTSVAEDFIGVGIWGRAWQIVQGPITQESKLVTFITERSIIV